MIFVTVGTHEQPFERLLRAVDCMRAAGKIDEPVFMQTGHTPYKPLQCGSRDFIPFPVMDRLFQLARITITHGGDCVMLVLKHGKIPIVAPRLKRYREHLDDHQLEFAEHLSRLGLAIQCPDTDALDEALDLWERKYGNAHGAAPVREHAHKFAMELDRICLALIRNAGMSPGFGGCP